MTYVIGTAGHVDHGKSTLVKALTGIDPDRLAEEKAREMTIDLGFAWLTLPDGTAVGIVDVPGHRDFIENMLAGVGGIDLALLVIAADEGIMPQTAEHIAILDLLAVDSAIVALTKIDLIQDADWLDLVTLDIEQMLEHTALAGAPVVPVSARTGKGLDTLLDTLSAALVQRPPRADLGRPRLPVDRVFTMSGFGTVVTGTLSGGSLRVGDEVEIAPGRTRARIRGLQSHKQKIESAGPGSRVAINLAGVAKDEIQRGDVVAQPGLLHGTELIDVQFRYLDSAERPLLHNSEVKFFSGAAEALAHVRLIGQRELASGEQGWLQIRLAQPIALDKGDRFILRYPSPPQTIGGGIVLDPHPPYRWRRFKEEVLERMEMLAIGTPAELVLSALEEQPASQRKALYRDLGMDAMQVDELVGDLVASGDVLELADGWLMAQLSWVRLKDQIRRELGVYHAEYPLRVGMPREALRSRLGLETRLFNLVIKMAAQEGLIGETGAAVHEAGRSVQFTPQQEAAIGRLLKIIASDPFNTPSIKDAVALVGEDVLQALFERGDLVQTSPEVLFDSATYQQMVQRITGYIREHGMITVGEARDLFNSSRKYVLALLEHMDGAGMTRREGEGRVLRGG